MKNKLRNLIALICICLGTSLFPSAISDRSPGLPDALSFVGTTIIVVGAYLMGEREGKREVK